MSPGKVRYQIGGEDGDRLLLWWDGDGELDEEVFFADVERNHGKGFAAYLRELWELDKQFTAGATAPARKRASIESEICAR